MDGGIHAREWITVASTMFFVKEVLNALFYSGLLVYLFNKKLRLELIYEANSFDLFLNDNVTITIAFSRTEIFFTTHTRIIK